MFHRLALLLAVLGLPALASAQGVATGPARAKVCTVATLAAATCAPPVEGTLAIVTDALDDSTCTGGGGSTRNWCERTSSAWARHSPGGAAAGTPLCTAAQLAAESCGGTTTNSIAIATDAGRDSIASNTCESATPTPTRSLVCQRDAGGTWRPYGGNRANRTLTIAATNAFAGSIAGADVRCGATRCDQEIQAAVNTLQARLGSGIEGGGTLRFTEGYFELQATVTLGTASPTAFGRVNLIGTGPGTTKVGQALSGAAFTLFKFEGNATQASLTGLTIRDLHIQGRELYGAGNDGAHCFDMLGDAPNEAVWDAHYYNLWIIGCPGAGIRTRAWGTIIESSVIEECGAGVVISHSTDARILDNKIMTNGVNIYFYDDTENGGFDGAPRYAKIIGNQFTNPVAALLPSWSAANYGLRITGDSHIIASNYIANTGADTANSILRMDDASQSVISGNIFESIGDVLTVGAVHLEGTANNNLLSGNFFRLGGGDANVVAENVNNTQLFQQAADGILHFFHTASNGLRFANTDGDTAGAFGPVLRAPPSSTMAANYNFTLPTALSSGAAFALVHDPAIARMRWTPTAWPGFTLATLADCIGLWLTAYGGGNATDACSNANSQSGADDGTETGGTIISAAESPAGSASNLSADADETERFVVADDVAFEVADFTVGCWARCQSIADCNHVIRKQTGATGWELTLANDGRIRMGVAGTSSNAAVGDALTVNTWAHIAGSYAGSDDDALRVYKDGAQVCPAGLCATIASPTIASTATLVIGGTSDGFGFDGNLKDCFYVDRVLTQGELAAIARCGALNADVDATRAASFATLAGFPGVSCAN